ncbi:Helix-turn-helix domain-containing protein [Pilibacter termitis]|uniref:Helix-turn-helix domain-containing protein n=1 Tax=Pilibacter termitis TaxID=263852 RepID=A0A1T4PVH6_9ENTE|nr:AraC family transcriptional regulator [Pilibacter termitis]SJZ95525.1 Helix-turn-helix domain-containing protein [Pilibacter termitis]
MKGNKELKEEIITEISSLEFVDFVAFKDVATSVLTVHKNEIEQLKKKENLEKWISEYETIDQKLPVLSTNKHATFRLYEEMLFHRVVLSREQEILGNLIIGGLQSLSDELSDTVEELFLLIKQTINAVFEKNDEEIHQMIHLLKKVCPEREGVEKLLLSFPRHSIYTINKQFKIHFEQTANQYYKELCFNYALKQISETDRACSEIAEEIGYCQYTSFSRAFKSRIGVTPNEYREKKCKRF